MAHAQCVFVLKTKNVCIIHTQDVYSWAIIMAEMLTGKLPWYGCPTMAIIYNVVFKKERPELPGEGWNGGHYGGVGVGVGVRTPRCLALTLARPPAALPAARCPTYWPTAALPTGLPGPCPAAPKYKANPHARSPRHPTAHTQTRTTTSGAPQTCAPSSLTAGTRTPSTGPAQARS